MPIECMNEKHVLIVTASLLLGAAAVVLLVSSAEVARQGRRHNSTAAPRKTANPHSVHEPFRAYATAEVRPSTEFELGKHVGAAERYHRNIPAEPRGNFTTAVYDFDTNWMPPQKDDDGDDDGAVAADPSFVRHVSPGDYNTYVAAKNYVEECVRRPGGALMPYAYLDMEFEDVSPHRVPYHTMRVTVLDGVESSLRFLMATDNLVKPSTTSFAAAAECSSQEDTIARMVVNRIGARKLLDDPAGFDIRLKKMGGFRVARRVPEDEDKDDDGNDDVFYPRPKVAIVPQDASQDERVYRADVELEVAGLLIDATVDVDAKDLTSRTVRASFAER